MFVCAHGDVSEYCNDHEMFICETWDGDIEDYRGVFRVLVTDREMSESEYYFLKGKMLGRGMELVSTRYTDNKVMAGYLTYQADRKKESHSVRQPFGFKLRNGVVTEIPEMVDVARKIIMLRDSGITLRQIRETPGICHPDGRKISVSTIQQIIDNRERYDK